MTRFDIIMRKAEELVRMGVWSNTDEAWEDAVSECEQSDSFEILYQENYRNGEF